MGQCMTALAGPIVRRCLFPSPEPAYSEFLSGLFQVPRIDEWTFVSNVAEKCEKNDLLNASESGDEVVNEENSLDIGDISIDIDTNIKGPGIHDDTSDIPRSKDKKRSKEKRALEVNYDGGPVCWAYSHPEGSTKLLFYCHGNAEDIDIARRGFLRVLAKSIGAHAVAVEYPGYGIAPGKATPQSVTEAVFTAYCYICNFWPAENIIVLGRSVGTGPVIRLVSELRRVERVVRTPSNDELSLGLDSSVVEEIHTGTGMLIPFHEAYGTPGCIVLISAYTSIKEVASHVLPCFGCFVDKSVWNSVGEIDEIDIPILFIHGRRDGLIPFHHSERLHHQCSGEKRFLFLPEHATHNHWEFWNDIYSPVVDFLDHCLSPVGKKRSLKFHVLQ